MGSIYRNEAAQLSPSGKALLRDDQRSFLRYAADLCRPGQVPLDAGNRLWRWSGRRPPGNADIVDQCLAEVIDKQSAALGWAVTRLGGRVFLTTSRYRVRQTQPTDDGVETPLDAVTEVKTLLQIDRPRTKAEIAWNRAMMGLVEHPSPEGLAESITIDDGDTDVLIEMRLISASPDLIVTRIDQSNYTKGMAHPQSNHWTQNWSLPLGRMLMEDEIFDGSKPWSTALAAEAEAHFKGYASAKPETPISDIGDSDRQWAFTTKGLNIGYDPYSLGSYVSGGNTLIPWSALAPYLRRPLPFDPGRLLEPKPSPP